MTKDTKEQKELTQEEKEKLEQETILPIEVNVQEFNVIVSSLGQMPHDRVRNVIDKIMAQAQQHIAKSKKE